MYHLAEGLPACCTLLEYQGVTRVRFALRLLGALACMTNASLVAEIENTSNSMLKHVT